MQNFYQGKGLPVALKKDDKNS